MTDNNLTNKFWQFVGQTSPYPPSLTISHAQDNTITDTSGKQYLDFIAGIAVTNVGHCHPQIVRAVQHQAARYAHTMVYGEHIQEPQVHLAEKIATIAPPGLNCTYFLTTGAEANDAALKLAVKTTRRHNFIAFTNAYHGDTIGALSCFGSNHFRDQFPGILANVQFLPYADNTALQQINETIAAVIIEPVQGEGGIQLPPPGYLQAIRQRCTETGTLLIFDEVQTGFGRTGHWFAAQTFQTTPDIITLAKGMGAGYPLAAVLSTRDLIYNFAAEPAFSHITTFGGHPVSCAAGLTAIQIIEEQNLLQNCQAQGSWLLNQLEHLITQHPGTLKTARGIGLMIGLETASPEIARTIVDTTRQNGLILETNLLNESVIRLSPALTITQNQCQQAIDILTRTLNSLP